MFKNNFKKFKNNFNNYRNYNKTLKNKNKVKINRFQVIKVNLIIKSRVILKIHSKIKIKAISL
jgi:hypothetical protein